MKKIYFIVSLAVIGLLSSCSEDYNEHNFPGYKDAANATNVANYTYTLVDADYTTIANAIKKPVTDSIATFKTQLKTANHADSITINAQITRLNNRLTTETPYINATYVGSNKLLNSELKGKDYIPLLLNQKYLYADKESLIKVTFDGVDTGDTLAIAATSRFTLTTADYDQIGTGVNKNFSSTSTIMTYLNIYLKNKCPYAVSGESKVVSYMFYDSNKLTKKQYRILVFDGQTWKCRSEQYIFTGKEWLIDPTIYISQITSDRTKDADGYPGDMKNMFSVIVHSVKNTDLIKKYVSTYKNDEYYYGASAYQGNFSFQYSVRESTPYSDPALIALTSEADKIKLMFDRVNESIIIYLKYAYPNVQPKTTDGLNQFLSVTFKAYEKYAAGTSTNTYQAKFQCTEVGKFKFIERKKL